jgi:hypothetical protein
MSSLLYNQKLCCGLNEAKRIKDEHSYLYWVIRLEGPKKVILTDFESEPDLSLAPPIF